VDPIKKWSFPQGKCGLFYILVRALVFGEAKTQSYGRKDEVHRGCVGGVEGVTVFFEALVLVAILEIGDKTQLVTISLATRHPWSLVLAGAVAGLAATTGIGAAIGGLLAASLRAWLPVIKVGGGVLFIVLGLWTVAWGFWNHGKAEEKGAQSTSRWGAFGEAFSLNFLAEFGDKTQIAVIILAASYEAPVSVFLGAGLGLAAISIMSVVIGAGLARILSGKWLRAVSAALFVVAGVILILEGTVFP
jgi:putative Ca2+/H+ antiporter (TMEM165/GDT1 family)